MLLTCPGCGDLCDSARRFCPECHTRLPLTGGEITVKAALTFTCRVCQLDSKDELCGCCGASLTPNELEAAA